MFSPRLRGSLVKLLFLVILPQVPKIIFILPLALALTAQAQQPGDAQAIQELAHANDLRRVGDAAQAKKIYEGYTPLSAEDVADAVHYCAGLPPHVCINDLVMTCTAQADAIYFYKKG